MDKHVDVKKEPPWYGEQPENGEPRDSTPRKETGEIGGIDQISQSSYSAAVNLVHGTKVKQEARAAATQPQPNSVIMDVDFDRIIPQFVCAPDADPLLHVAVSGGPSIKREPAENSGREPLGPQGTSLEFGDGVSGDDYGTLPSPAPGGFVFCPVVGIPSVKECYKPEPGESEDKITDNDTLEFVDSSSEVDDNAAKEDESSEFSLQAEQFLVNDTTDLCGGNVCDTCGEELQSPSALRQHALLHGSGKKHKHKQFNVRPAKRDDPNEHVVINVAVEPPTEDRCAKPMTMIRVSTPKVKAQVKSKPFACDQCAVRFTTRSHMKTHMMIHAGQKEFGCDLCGARFVKSSCLTRHKGTHSEARPHACDVCDARFSQKSSLSTHKRIHAGDKQYACDVCDARFTQSSTLKSHKRVHTGEKPFGCDQCESRFTRSSDLKTHRRKHTGETPYQCDDCGVRFTLKANLVKHRRTHTGERPYPCLACGARFTQLGNLAKHRRIHTRDCPFACGFCEATFASNYTLNTHSKLHSGQMPYFCDVCEARFAERDHLTAHKTEHAGV